MGMSNLPVHSQTHGKLPQSLPDLEHGVHHKVLLHHSSSDDACPGRHNEVRSQCYDSYQQPTPATTRVEHQRNTFSNTLIRLMATNAFPLRWNAFMTCMVVQ